MTQLLDALDWPVLLRHRFMHNLVGPRDRKRLPIHLEYRGYDFPMDSLDFGKHW